MPPQNIYDNPTFFATYSTFLRQTAGLPGAPEWPPLLSFLGGPASLSGTRVLDLGCGFGWFCRFAREQGAVGAVGVDYSERMLERAREYVRGDLDELDLAELGVEDEEVDVVFSSLTFHYLLNLEELFKKVFKALKPGGKFVFSVEHPIMTAPRDPAPSWGSDTSGKPGADTSTSTSTSNSSGGKDKEYWPLNSYYFEGPRVTDWLAPGVVKQHRTTETFLRLLLRCGFRVTGFREWMPSDGDLERFPEWERERHKPSFLLVGVVKE
ncbi:methylase [Aulographum hederae CBS 113979]|uniref:Methylase n=1 Tax=Aulographum hederae CBS 113979 TaxID=1176131 RepID=A0A6G1GNJ2_9PEZI|nr:methylase [Aulographum hederae CBS 113979]